MKIYNTLTRQKEDFTPLVDNEVSMYVCGPTVYDYIHIGNARPIVVFDTVRRYFEYKDYKVNFVQNFTDIDDKIINKANSENVSFDTISNKYIDEALEDSNGLNVKDSLHPKVTEEIPEIIEMISELIEKGYAYEVNGAVYFDARNYKNYGRLSKKNIDDLISGARVAVNEEKKSSVDFILWKPAKENEPSWESPWGLGRPGWHIECSVMSKKYLGDTIDIHGGGEDLVFPHHENEIAQSESLTGKPLANYWMHNGFINVDNEKMSKSKGNFFTLRDIIKSYSYEEIRFFILSCHYRSPLNFSDELMDASRNGLNRIRTAITNMNFYLANSKEEKISDEETELLKNTDAFVKDFEKAMEDDFNTADAITAIYELVKYININTSENSSREYVNSLLLLTTNLLNILGLDIKEEKEDLDSEIEDLIAKRQEARANKDWATADSIRDRLNELNIVLEDTPLGVRWSYK